MSGRRENRSHRDHSHSHPHGGSGHSHGEGYQDSHSADMRAELDHFNSVVVSFQEYFKFMLRELMRRAKAERMIDNRFAKHMSVLPSARKLQLLKEGIQNNQKFLKAIIENYGGFGPAGAQEIARPPQDKTIASPDRHFVKIVNTLHQCVRDWSAEGKEERDESYLPILEELERRLPTSNSADEKYKVLVPGAGLGRLALEIAGRGYVSQGNEFSYFMLLTSNFLLNCVGEREALAIYPWIDNPSNTRSIDDLYRPTLIPDESPADILGIGEDHTGETNFSMTAGEFLEVYKSESRCWDAVVTCFFLDTAPNVMEYIETIHRLLKPGGFWINFGPLLYHWQSQNDGETDERYGRSIELSWEEIHDVVESFGFSIIKEEWRQARYTRNPTSMMQVNYNCVFMTAVKGPR